jgi:hypothetical protein
MKSNYLLILFYFYPLWFCPRFDVGGVVKETGSGLPIPGVNIQVKKYN